MDRDALEIVRVRGARDESPSLPAGAVVQLPGVEVLAALRGERQVDDASVPHPAAACPPERGHPVGPPLLVLAQDEVAVARIPQLPGLLAAVLPAHHLA